jgi:isopenicillin N synthase-like dioxygenase
MVESPRFHTMATTCVVALSYEALLAGDDLTAQIEAAFGIDGLGILTVSGVPDLERLRAALLPLAREFATLPEAARAQYEDAASFYSVGWSHGKEKLGGGRLDLAKGSFYNNPLHNRPFADPALVEAYPSFAAPNIWPTAHVPAMEGAFMALGQRMVEVGRLVAVQCDTFIARRCPTYAPPDKLARLLTESRVCKGRLLHYYALPDSAHPDSEAVAAAPDSTDADFAGWCGWHNDHGSLTALVQPLYLDEATGGAPAAGATADPTAGLYVRGRRGQLARVRIPDGHVAFQIGETAQVHSGGLLQATPHAVRAPAARGVCRSTFAVFMEPEWGCPMDVPAGVDPRAAQSAEAVAALPPGVPPLHERWGTAACPFSTCDFGQFSEATFKMFY